MLYSMKIDFYTEDEWLELYKIDYEYVAAVGPWKFRSLYYEELRIAEGCGPLDADIENMIEAQVDIVLDGVLSRKEFCERMKREPPTPVKNFIQAMRAL